MKVWLNQEKSITMWLYENLSSKDKKLEDVLKENEELRRQMAEERKQHTRQRDFQIDKISEAETRKRFIDLELKEAGWSIGTNCTVEEPVTGMCCLLQGFWFSFCINLYKCWLAELVFLLDSSYVINRMSGGIYEQTAWRNILYREGWYTIYFPYILCHEHDFVIMG